MFDGFFFKRSTSSDEDFQLNQNLSIIFISHTKILMIFFSECKNILSRNVLANKQTIKHIFLPFYLFFF